MAKVAVFRGRKITPDTIDSVYATAEEHLMMGRVVRFEYSDAATGKAVEAVVAVLGCNVGAVVTDEFPGSATEPAWVRLECPHCRAKLVN